MLFRSDGDSRTTWVDLNQFMKDYPTFDLEDKVISVGEGNVMSNGPNENKRLSDEVGSAQGNSGLMKTIRKSNRTRKEPAKFHDYEV